MKTENKTFATLLKDLSACSDAKEWAGEKTIEQVVKECHRGDWLLWLAEKVNIGLQPLTLAKGHCAATALLLMKDERSKAAVKAAVDFGEGKTTKEELAAAATAAAYTATAAATAAANAAAAAAYAAAYAPTAAAYAAANAAAAAAYAAAYAPTAAAYAAAKAANQLATADICRKYIGELIIEQVNQILNTI